jgi:CheY-like chemotaxis protein
MKKVLIVDDETRLLQSIEAGLKSYLDEFHVITAQNGKEAVHFLERENINLVVTDLRMPEMDGFELLAHLTSAHPFMPTIVMTAFATPEIEDRLNASGTSKLLEKPIDIEKLAEAIREGLRQKSNEGALAGFSLANFLQLLEMEKRTCLLNVQDGNMHGHIYVNQGNVHAAVADGMKGEDAIYHLLSSEHVNITFQKLPKRRIQQMIKIPLMSLLIEAMRRKDEKLSESSSVVEDEEVNAEQGESVNEIETEQQSPEIEATPSVIEGEQLATTQGINVGDDKMGKLEDTLGRLAEIEGFMAVGIFTPNGEMAAQVNKSNLKLAEIGSLANDVLLKAQKATDIMNVGRGQVVHIDAPNAHVIARCFNENEDFTQSQSGKAHIHVVLLLSKDGNLAMGKMKLESVVKDAAIEFR